VSARLILVLGRDGMGADATEEDFDRWVSYVTDHIDKMCSFGVEVERTGQGDVQNDRVSGYDGTGEERATVLGATEQLWDRWCQEGAP
jgi:hypothetical protein